MIDYLSLAKSTKAYKTVLTERNTDTLSHAYLFISADKKLPEFLKIFAAEICCKDGDPCMNCRNCRLILSGTHPDVFNFPKGETVLTEDIETLIDESYIKPLESDKKIFIISSADTMNASAQNKLLKTLEEPPKNVYILLGAKSESYLLSTVLSRVKKIEIPAFSDKQLYDALISEYTDSEKLTDAISLGDGTVGTAERYYSDKNTAVIEQLISDIIVNMNSSRDILAFSERISKLKDGFTDLLNGLEVAYRDMLFGLYGKADKIKNKTLYQTTKNATGYGEGAIIDALESIEQANKRKKFNANSQMLTEWLLFKILEGKHKWQKL